MNRRNVLEWFSRGLAGAVAVTIGLPGARYLVGSGKTRMQSAAGFERLKRLKDLPVGKPLLVPILGRSQDGWTVSDQQVVGRVWVVRKSEDSHSASPEAVQVFTSVCPHMGCRIQAHPTASGFVCPCHRASFALDGSRQPDAQTGGKNHAPRDMDPLEHRLVKDAASGDVWLEVKQATYVTGTKERNIQA